MERIEKIRMHPLYRDEYARLRRMEQGREYCGHDMEHFLDVARVCWILNLERQLGISKEVIYAAGLLHDIGKGLQYESGIPHQEAGAELARKILPECGFAPEETDAVAGAISLHRKKQDDAPALAQILYQADKQTRLCFACEAAGSCNWPEEKKNNSIIY